MNELQKKVLFSLIEQSVVLHCDLNDDCKKAAKSLILNGYLRELKIEKKKGYIFSPKGKEWVNNEIEYRSVSKHIHRYIKENLSFEISEQSDLLSGQVYKEYTITLGDEEITSGNL